MHFTRRVSPRAIHSVASTTTWFPVTRRVYYTAHYIVRPALRARMDQKRARIGFPVEFSVRRRHFVSGFVFRRVAFSRKRFPPEDRAVPALKPDTRPSNCSSHRVSERARYFDRKWAMGNSEGIRATIDEKRGTLLCIKCSESGRVNGSLLWRRRDGTA